MAKLKETRSAEVEAARAEVILCARGAAGYHWDNQRFSSAIQALAKSLAALDRLTAAERETDHG